MIVWTGTYTDSKSGRVTQATIEVDAERLSSFFCQGRANNPAFRKCAKEGKAITTRLAGGVTLKLAATPTTEN